MTSDWKRVLTQYCRHPLGVIAACILILFCLSGIYAPFLASSKPFAVYYEGTFYFPLFRYLLYRGFYTKGVDLFFNALMMTLPLFLVIYRTRFRKFGIMAFLIIQSALFFYALLGPAYDPSYESIYARLNPLIQFKLAKVQQERLLPYQSTYESIEEEYRGKTSPLPTLWQMIKEQKDPTNWEEMSQESEKLHILLMPFLSSFHWQDDAGGSQLLNQVVPWWELTRINRKDLLASLIFGIRVSMVVGIVAVGLSLLIGIPLGAFSGYFGGKMDIIVCRLLEVWESMPVFFMLLLVVSMLESKSIFLVISVIGLFGWTSISRFIRGECLKQRSLPYIEACYAQGFSHSYTIFVHIIPNAIPPVITLVPFAVMAAITSEAGLSFLGLGEEGSCSWGVLMDEGRTVFPAESYLLWPPAILLTILLVSIALAGDTLRDSLDPKMKR